MKRILSLAMVLAIIFSLVACGGSSEAKTETKKRKKQSFTLEKIEDKYKGQFRVGFSRADITPTDVSVPLTGYGNEPHRLSTGYLTPLTTDAVAISDENNNTIIILQFDIINFHSNEVPDAVYLQISKRVGIPEQNIILNCSHTHSAPAVGYTGMTSIQMYNQFLIQTVCDNAVNAMKNREVCSDMLYGETETYHCNFIRHYIADNGKGESRAMGDNHWDIWWADLSDTEYPNKSLKHISEVDPTIYMLKFECPDSDPIYIASFRAHNTQTGSSTKYVMSADWVGKLRDMVEEKYPGSHCMYLQGNCGNINPSSRIEADNYTRDYVETARRISEYAFQVVDNMKSIGTGNVTARKFTVECPSNKDDAKLVAGANLVQAYWKKSNDSSETKRYAYKLGIVSQYAASHIIASQSYGATINMTSTVMVIGDLALTFAPGEMFDQLGHDIIAGSPYKYTIPLSYSGRTYGYIPTSAAFDYGCYETDTCPEGKGSGEMLVKEYINQLNDIKKNTK